MNKNSESVFIKELFDRLPDGWSGRRMKYLAEIRFSNVDKKSEDNQKEVLLCNYTDVYKNDLITGSLDFMKATASNEEVAKFGLRPNDVLITKDSETADDIGVPAIIAENIPNLVCGYHLSILRPGNEVLGRFLFRYLQSTRTASFFEKRANGITRFAIGMDAVGDCPVVFPSLRQQQSVAHLLDKEAARIDALISRKERQIELLEEKRIAIISRAVTKGLNPKAKMKSSGVEWIGEIPADWNVAPLYARYELQLGKMLDAKQITGVYLVPYLRNVDVAWDEINATNLPQMDILPHQRNALRLRVGDLLVCEGGEIGKAAIWNGEVEECYFQKALHRLRPRATDAIPRFLYYCLFAFSTLGVFSADAPTSTIEHLTGERLRRFRFPSPPRQSQIEIAELLDSREKEGRLQKRRVERSIELLQEYRSSLIAAAVSGQMDVTAMKNGTGR